MCEPRCPACQPGTAYTNGLWHQTADKGEIFMLDCAIYNSDGGWNGSGDVVSRLVSTNFDPRVCRPFIWNGRSYVSVQKGYKDGKPVLHNVPTMNAATLRKEDWVMIDQAVVQASRPRLGA